MLEVNVHKNRWLDVEIGTWGGEIRKKTVKSHIANTVKSLLARLENETIVSAKVTDRKTGLVVFDEYLS